MDTLATSPRPRMRLTTQAAEGVPRWRWTTEELVRLREQGFFSDMDRFELIGGEIIPMSPTGRRHAVISDAIIKHWSKIVPAGVRVGEEKQLNLDDVTFLKPDLLVWPESILIPDVRGPDVLLLIEVAHTTLKKDTGIKKDVYASFGVHEYWVMDANDLSVIRHRSPTPQGYADVSTASAADIIAPVAVPSLTVRMADFGL